MWSEDTESLGRQFDRCRILLGILCDAASVLQTSSDVTYVLKPRKVHDIAGGTSFDTPAYNDTQSMYI